MPIVALNRPENRGGPLGQSGGRAKSLSLSHHHPPPLPHSLHLKPHRQKPLDHREIGAGVRGEFGAGVAGGLLALPDGQGQWQRPLVGQMGAEGGVADLVGAHLTHQIAGDLLGADTFLAELGKDFGEVFVHQGDVQRIAGAFVLAGGDFAQLLDAPAEVAAELFQLAPGHGAWQRRCQALGVAFHAGAAPGQVEGLQAGRGGVDRRVDHAAAGRVEAEPAQGQLRIGAEAAHQRRVAARQEVERRRHRVVRAAAQLEPARRVSQHQRRPDGLQHQRAATGGADAELVITRPHLPRHERQRLRVQRRPAHLGAADRGRRLHAGQVLTHQAGLGAAGADRVQREGSARAHRQGQRGAQDLPAALAGGAIDLDHGVLLVVLLVTFPMVARLAHPFTQTTCFKV